MSTKERLAALALAAGLTAACAAPPVGPAPIIPSASLVDVCTVTLIYKVRYTYTVHGSGYWWGHTATSNSLVSYLRDGSTLTFYAVGESWVMFTDDPDDNGTRGIQAGGGHLPAIWPHDKECP